VVSGLRRFRSDHSINPRMAFPAVIRSDARAHVLRDHAKEIMSTARLSDLAISDGTGALAEHARIQLSDAAIYIPLAALGRDAATERARLQKEHAKHEAEAERIAGKLDDPNFAQRAPADVVET